MAKKIKSPKLEDLAQRRTELAHERTMLSYLRSFAALIIFGIALISFSDSYGIALFYSGLTAIVMGAILGVITAKSYIHHRKKWKEMGLI
jgi:uncharacterized membrane protein YidH (DUF202 family)